MVEQSSQANIKNLPTDSQAWPSLYFENKYLKESESAYLRTEPTSPRDFVQKSHHIAQKLFKEDETLREVQATMDSMARYGQILDQKISGYEQKLDRSFGN